MTDERSFFDQPINDKPINDIKTYENMWIVATGQGDNYITGCNSLNQTTSTWCWCKSNIID